MLKSGLLALVAVGNFMIESNNAAVATFSAANSGVAGTVTVSDGSVTVDLDLSSLDTSLIGGAECFTNGFSYHIHEKWTPDDNDDRVADCGSSLTGGHWDPWLACGGATGNVFCSSKGGCVTGSSVLDSDDGYTCDNFDSNPYSCEVGDWSGKYGSLDVDSITNTIYRSDSHYLEVDGTDLAGLSVVFHCSSDGSRAFCAPFTDTDEDSNNNARPQPTGDSQIAVFQTLGDGNSIVLKNNGDYEIMIDRSTLTSLPSDCGNSLLYRVYNDWEDVNSVSAIGEAQCNDKIMDSFYDPTITCASDDTDATSFCSAGGILCNDNLYSYECDYDNNRFESCAPGDLSGKYGEIDDLSNTNTIYTNSGDDELMIDLNLIHGKTAVLQCSDTYEIVACAQFRDFVDLECLDTCNNNGDECTCAEANADGKCQVCNENDGQGCSQCKSDYFRTSQDTLCGDCDDIPNCQQCGNNQGCQQCNSGYFKVYNSECGFNYCI